MAIARFRVSNVPGLVSHYWGRRLPDRWWWVSANRFEDSDVAVEALFARTRIWNSARVPMYAGYLWIEHLGVVQQVIHPLNGLIRVEGSPESFTLRARRLGRPAIIVRCSAVMNSYSDLGEGIKQTLLGNCLIDGIGEARETAGIEFRAQSITPISGASPL